MRPSREKANLLPPGLVSNLQDVLSNRKGKDPDSSNNEDGSNELISVSNDDDTRPVVMVTNADEVEFPGLTYLVHALVTQELYNIHVCAPQPWVFFHASLSISLDGSTASHSFTLKETIAVASTEIHGAIAYEVSGITLSLFYSGVVAGARESLFSGVPSISISLDWKKDESQESDFKDAVGVCLPLINAALRDIEKGAFPKCCLLHVQVPKSPLTNKKLIVDSEFPGPGLQETPITSEIEGAAHQLATQKNNIEEVESVGVAGKSDTNRKAKYF
ncbi:putative nucleosome assembly protein C2D10.11C-like [Capsicum annuum]|nr:putative nucleosome assembly protein C2D10.11C-like [Capsicum annuum]